VKNYEIWGQIVKRCPEIEWRDIARTRDKLIHSYFSVNVEILWKIAKYNIPELKRKLEYLIQKEGWQDEI